MGLEYEKPPIAQAAPAENETASRTEARDLLRAKCDEALLVNAIDKNDFGAEFTDGVATQLNKIGAEAYCASAVTDGVTRVQIPLAENRPDSARQQTLDGRQIFFEDKSIRATVTQNGDRIAVSDIEGVRVNLAKDQHVNKDDGLGWQILSVAKAAAVTVGTGVSYATEYAAGVNATKGSLTGIEAEPNAEGAKVIFKIQLEVGSTTEERQLTHQQWNELRDQIPFLRAAAAL